MSAGLTNVQWLRLKTGDRIKWGGSHIPWMVVGRVTVKGSMSNESVAVRTDSRTTRALLLMKMDDDDTYEPPFIVVSYRPEWSRHDT